MFDGSCVLSTATVHAPAPLHIKVVILVTLVERLVGRITSLTYKLLRRHAFEELQKRPSGSNILCLLQENGVLHWELFLVERVLIARLITLIGQISSIPS
jgi:hypothetical protein